MSDVSERNAPFPEESKDTTQSEKLIQEFIDRMEAGESVDPDEYFTKYPELEDDLLRLFEQIKDRKPSPENPEKEEAEDAGKDAPRILGDFQILGEIGKGGMGVVYEAIQVSLKRPVALKILPEHLRYSSKAVEKFHREAEAGGRQNHPGIVSIIAVGEHEGVHYIAQELIEGGYTLGDKLEDLRGEDRLKGEQDYYYQLAGLILKVAEALQHAHTAGVIHRDVKPSNILLTKDGIPKITDFGLARVENALALSHTGDFSGTPYYMSPEQAMSRRMGIDHRTDIFSLGVTLYEALTLSRPFDGETSQEVLKKIVMLDPRDPRKVNRHVPRDLAVICLKALEKIPDNRYTAMKDFAEDLRRFLEDEVILARPASRAAKLWRIVKRNAALSAAVTVAVFAVAALVLSLSIPSTSGDQLSEILMERAEKCREMGDLKMADNYERIAKDWRQDKDELSPRSKMIPLDDNAALGSKSDVKSSTGIDKNKSAQQNMYPKLMITVYDRKKAELVGVYDARDFAGRESLSAHADESVRIHTKLPGPAYCFLIALNSDGSDHLCFPLDEDVTPSKIERLEFPEEKNQFFDLKDSAGLQAFVLVTQATPLPSYREWKEKAGKLPWQKTEKKEAWGYNGSRYNVLDSPEHTIQSRGGLPPMNLTQTLEHIEKNARHATVNAVAFPIDQTGGSGK